MVSGQEILLGSTGVVLNDTQADAAAGSAWVRVRGEQWQAHSPAPLRPGQQVRVVGRKGMVLSVAPILEEGT